MWFYTKGKEVLRLIITYLIIIVMSILTGINIRTNLDKSALYERTNIKDVSHDKDCKDGICPMPEELKK